MKKLILILFSLAVNVMPMLGSKPLVDSNVMAVKPGLSPAFALVSYFDTNIDKPLPGWSRHYAQFAAKKLCGDSPAVYANMFTQ